MDLTQTGTRKTQTYLKEIKAIVEREIIILKAKTREQGDKIDFLITHIVTILNTQDKDRTKDLIIKLEVIEALIAEKDKKVTK